MARHYETQGTESWKHYKKLPNESFGNVIPNTNEIMTKILKFSPFTEICEFFEIPIMSKQRKN